MAGTEQQCALPSASAEPGAKPTEGETRFGKEPPKFCFTAIFLPEGGM